MDIGIQHVVTFLLLLHGEAVLPQEGLEQGVSGVRGGEKDKRAYPESISYNEQV